MRTHLSNRFVGSHFTKYSGNYKGGSESPLFDSESEMANKRLFNKPKKITPPRGLSKYNLYFQSFATIDGLYQTTYEEELEINDFPQSCRWKVTSREAIGNITDYSEADIQIRGVYYPPGKEPGEGEERKLFLLITGRVLTLFGRIFFFRSKFHTQKTQSGQTELSVQKAKGEITRIIKEEFTRLQTSYQAPKVGRFKVA